MPCDWQYALGTWRGQYWAGNPNATFKLWVVGDPPGSPPIFNGAAPNPCDSYFVNTFIDPVIDRYYGGYAILVYREPADCVSLSDLMDLLNMEIKAGTYAVPRPKIDDETVITVARHEDATNIKILYETP